LLLVAAAARGRAARLARALVAGRGSRVFLYAGAPRRLEPKLLPPRWMLVAIVVLGLAGIWLQYRAMFGARPE
jgi:hypothetical protein